MSVDLIKYAFIAGEVSPALYGRTDLTKYDLGIAEAYNFFVDYRGGLSSRPGFEFVDYLEDYDEEINTGRTLELVDSPFLFPFQYNPAREENFILVVAPSNGSNEGIFSHSTIKFLRNGSYVVTDKVDVSAVSLADPAVITTASPHGFANGDWVKFNRVSGERYLPLLGRTFQVANAAASTFQLIALHSGEVVDSLLWDAFTSTFEVGRIYTLTCNYRPGDYSTMCWTQHQDFIRITHPDYPIRTLTCVDGTIETISWELTEEVVGSSSLGPTVTGSSASDTGAAETVFTVTAVYDDDTETAAGIFFHLGNIVNYPATEGSVSITWAPDVDASYYNVYRSIVSYSETLTSGVEVGFVGRTKGTKFTDPNIIPDFTRTPPQHYNPFALPGVVDSISLTSGGSGYIDFATVITLTDASSTGFGFTGSAAVDPSTGEIVNIIITNRGEQYTEVATEINFVGGGTGAAGVINWSPYTYTYPSANCTYQQRQIYAATYSRPTTVWGSKTSRFTNFDASDNILDSDGFEFVLDTSNVAPIRHLLPTQGGLLAMTKDAIWILNGGGPNEPLTPSNTLATAQTYNGVSKVRPIKVGSDLLYVEGNGFAVRTLAYNELSRVYSGDDRSILSSHLFGKNKEIISWAYQESPFKVVWAVRSDGMLLAFTVVKSEDVYAWTPCGTKGQFLSITNVRENNALTDEAELINDRVYVVTQRYIGGRWRRMIERMALRDFVNLEDAYCVDAGWNLAANHCYGNLNITKNGDGTWTGTTDTGNVETSVSDF